MTINMLNPISPPRPQRTLSFRRGNYTRSFLHGFEAAVKDLGEWRPASTQNFDTNLVSVIVWPGEPLWEKWMCCSEFQDSHGNFQDQIHKMDPFAKVPVRIEHMETHTYTYYKCAYVYVYEHGLCILCFGFLMARYPVFRRSNVNY